jgi:replicative DNA helicase
MQRATPEAEVSFHRNSGADPFGNAPPYSLDAEQAVLGAILLWNDAMGDLSFLEPGHFWDPLHGQIMATARDVIQQGRIANPVTLGPVFKDATPVDDETSVPVYLGVLGARAATRASLKDTAQLIVDLADRRQLVLIGEDLASAAREANPEYRPKEIIEEIEGRLFEIAERAQKQLSTTISFSEAAQLAVKRADSPYTGIRTHFRGLDNKILGLEPSDLIVLAGRPSMGKTALATNIAFNVAKDGHAVHFFSLEMSAEQLAMRILAEKIEVPSSHLRAGRGSVNDNQMRRLVLKAQELDSLNLHIDQLGGASIAQVVARARRHKRKHKTALVVIDYLQLMQASRRRENRVQDITEITTGLKALAKELNVPVLALSQLSRATESRENKRPQLSDLRESGSIEQDADVVMFVYREEYYVERDKPADVNDPAYNKWLERMAVCKNMAEVIIGKARHSEAGVVPMAFSGALTRFSDLVQEGSRHD